MKSRPFYLLALVLLTAVLPFDIASKTRVARAVSTAARAVATKDAVERESLRLESRTCLRDSERFSVAALAVFFCGLGAWACSLSRKEGGLQGVPLLLTALGILTQLIMV